MEHAHRVLRIRRDGSRRSDAVQSPSWPVRPSDRYLEREARRALQGECMAQRRPFEAEGEMDRKSWREEILMWLHTKPTVNLNHNKWSYIMQTNGLVKLKWNTEEYLKN